MKRFLGCVGLFCLFFGVRGQGLKVGDRVPDVVVTGVSGLGAAPVHLVSGFKGKLLVLDFWATWCAPCRAMLPRLDSLQRAFGDKVLLLPVGYEARPVVLPVLRAMGRDAGLPLVTGDVVLGRLFPHRSLPHEVWIRDGVVVAITGYEELTAAKVRLMLGGGASLALKRDSTARYDAGRALLIDGNGGNGNTLLYHALLAGYTPGLTGGYTIGVPDSSGRRITARNMSIPNLYALAFGEDKRFIGDNRIVLEVKDTAAVRFKGHGRVYIEWMRQQHAFCYELVVPRALSGQAYQLMQEDLRRLFPRYTAALEKRPEPCLVLRRTSAVDKLRSRGGQPLTSVGPFGATLINQWLGGLTGPLGVIYLQHQPPLVDETGYRGPVDLRITGNLSDLGALNTALAAYDLRISREERPVEMLVIRDEPKL